MYQLVLLYLVKMKICKMSEKNI